MKKLLSIVYGLLLATTLLFAENSAKISFETKEHNFGTIPEEIGNASCEFVFMNTGNTPLVLNKVTASCGCTTPSWTKEPVAPGKTGKVVVTYKAQGRPGAFHKSITVYSNSKDGAEMLLIRGEVTPRSKNPEVAYPYDLGDGIKANKREIKISALKDNEVKKEIISIYNSGKSAVEVKCNTHNSKFISCSENSLKIMPKEFGQFTIEVNGKGAPDLGRIKDYFYINVNNDNKQTETRRINVVATVTENFDGLSKSDWEKAPIASFSDVLFNFGNPNGKKIASKLEIKNVGKSTLKIRKVIVENNLFVISGGKENIKPGGTATYSIHVKEDKKITGNVTGAIVFITNDPSAPIRTVKLVAHL